MSSGLLRGCASTTGRSGENRVDTAHRPARALLELPDASDAAAREGPGVGDDECACRVDPRGFGDEPDFVGD